MAMLHLFGSLGPLVVASVRIHNVILGAWPVEMCTSASIELDGEQRLDVGVGSGGGVT